MIDLDALEAKARAATPRNWQSRNSVVEQDRTRKRVADAFFGEFGAEAAEDNAAHVAAFDPTTALALIARIRELEAALAPFAKHLRFLSMTLPGPIFADGTTPIYGEDRVTGEEPLFYHSLCTDDFREAARISKEAADGNRS